MDFLTYASTGAVKDLDALSRKCIRMAGLNDSFSEDGEQEIWIAWSKMKVNKSEDHALIVSKAISAGKFAAMDLRRRMQYPTAISRQDFYQNRRGEHVQSVEFFTTDSRAEIHTAHSVADPTEEIPEEEVEPLDEDAALDEAFDLADMQMTSRHGTPDAERLSRILDMVPPASRRVVIDFVYGESLESCARRHGVTTKAIQHSIERALKALGLSEKK